jgi:hypothetical protein
MLSFKPNVRLWDFIVSDLPQTKLVINLLSSTISISYLYGLILACHQLGGIFYEYRG